MEKSSVTIQFSSFSTRVLAVFLIGVVGAMPLFSAEKSTTAGNDKDYTYEQGKIDGKKAAKGNGVFFFTGCIAPLAFVLPWVIGPKVPTDHLVGKPAEYVDGYVDGYKAQAKLKNFGWGMLGSGRLP
ncbi:MAG: hypothetical protein AB1798_12785 [Spirochaetota bacterium]